jgi:hypothetical protein
MTTEQREQLREVLIDYIQFLTYQTLAHKVPEQAVQHRTVIDKKIAQVRLLLREVA